MISIRKATLNDTELLTNLGKTTFLEAHGKSAPEKDIMEYVNNKFTNTVFAEELNDKNNIFHIIQYNETAVGYSKIIYNAAHSNIPIKNSTKLERLYVLEAYHSLKLGYQLFKHNLDEAIKNQQAGMWLFVWTENQKAINFYKKLGFEVVGEHSFQISKTHYNPNYHMFLTIKN